MSHISQPTDTGPGYASPHEAMKAPRKEFLSMPELKSWKRGLCAVLAYAALLTILAVLHPSPAETQRAAQNVRVTNATSQPVPTAVQGTPTVKAAQSGGWNVLVTNPNTAPVPTYNALDGMEPFQRTISSGDSLTVPAGKRLVIEHVSLFGENDGGNIYLVWLFTIAGGTSAVHYLSFEFSTTSPGGSRRFTGSNVMRIYADPNTTLEFNHSSDAGVDKVVLATLSGYLVPSP